MDNENKTPEHLTDEEWLQEILDIRQTVEQISRGDEQSDAQIDPDELDIERIVRETLEENQGSKHTPKSETETVDSTLLFARQEVLDKMQETAQQIPIASFPEQDLPVDALLEAEDVVPEPIDEVLLENQISIEDLQRQPNVMTEQTVKVPVQDVLQTQAELSDAEYIDQILEAAGLAVQPAQETPAAETDTETTEEAVEEQPEEEEPIRKTRPKMKKGYGLFGLPHVAVTAIWLAIIVSVGSFLGNFLWICAADLLAFGKEPMEAVVTITVEDLEALKNEDSSDDNEAAKAVAKKLKEAGLIDHEWLFEFFSAKLTSKIRNISPGTYVFTDAMIYDYNALIKMMTDYGADAEVVQIMFPEGYTCAQIYQLLEDNGICTVADMEAYVMDLQKHIQNNDIDDYWFLKELTLGHKYSLEGYLYPDTYLFYKDEDPGKVLGKFLDAFALRAEDNRLQEKWLALNDRMREQMKANGYGENYIADHQLSFHDVVILASIVEKESANQRESYTVASVFFNRLCHPSRYPKLESDATIDYAINYYNKGELTTDELINASPYHTYTHDGLPAGPIANPGLNSLGAALNPEETQEDGKTVYYYFFILNKETGEHVFSKTREEHNRWEEELGYHD